MQYEHGGCATAGKLNSIHLKILKTRACRGALPCLQKKTARKHRTAVGHELSSMSTQRTVAHDRRSGVKALTGDGYLNSGCHARKSFSEFSGAYRLYQFPDFSLSISAHSCDTESPDMPDFCGVEGCLHVALGHLSETFMKLQRCQNATLVSVSERVLKCSHKELEKPGRHACRTITPTRSRASGSRCTAC